MRDVDEAKILSVTPNVCLTPVGNSMLPTPYNIIDYGGHDGVYTPTVTLSGFASMVLLSHSTHVHGDEAGTGGGVKSGTRSGICEPIQHEPTVRSEGSPMIRHGDICWMNNKNTIGQCQFIRSMDINQLPKPKVPETAADRRKKELEDRVHQLEKELDANKGSYNPYNWGRDSLRRESLANARSMLADLESGSSRGVMACPLSDHP